MRKFRQSRALTSLRGLDMIVTRGLGACRICQWQSPCKRRVCHRQGLLYVSHLSPAGTCAFVKGKPHACIAFDNSEPCTCVAFDNGKAGLPVAIVSSKARARVAIVSGEARAHINLITSETRPHIVLGTGEACTHVAFVTGEACPCIGCACPPVAFVNGKACGHIALGKNEARPPNALKFISSEARAHAAFVCICVMFGKGPVPGITAFKPWLDIDFVYVASGSDTQVVPSLVYLGLAKSNHLLITDSGRLDAGAAWQFDGNVAPCARTCDAPEQLGLHVHTGSKDSRRIHHGMISAKAITLGYSVCIVVIRQGDILYMTCSTRRYTSNMVYALPRVPGPTWTKLANLSTATQICVDAGVYLGLERSAWPALGACLIGKCGPFKSNQIKQVLLRGSAARPTAALQIKI
ncbi:hypothetical protein GGX14DRAFT_403924 [Mycena pura]|uniref:Uncharacterized protein n=1 Tax=Mycena pura TaxID=153505 RepID=A0AAD6Y7Z2_9AGAR|nr:hypothetical protein GGX14DRAFT_403924 [Mycena pura]